MTAIWISVIENLSGFKSDKQNFVLFSFKKNLIQLPLSIHLEVDTSWQWVLNFVQMLGPETKYQCQVENHYLPSHISYLHLHPNLDYTSQLNLLVCDEFLPYVFHHTI